MCEFELRAVLVFRVKKTRIGFSKNFLSIGYFFLQTFENPYFLIKLSIMESIFESQRHWHEERERCIDAMVRDMLVEKKTVSLQTFLPFYNPQQPFQQKERVNSDQRIKKLMDRHQASTQKLINAYHDESGERSRELNAISGPGVFAEYYARLKAIKDYHRTSKNEPANLLMLEFSKMNTFVEDPDRVEKETVKFSDEEGYGLFLDLYAVFTKYINLKGIKVGFKSC